MWFDSRARAVVPPLFGDKGGLPPFVMACSSGWGKGYRALVTGITKCSPWLQFYACPLAQAESVNDSWNNSIKNTDQVASFGMNFQFRRRRMKDREPLKQSSRQKELFLTTLGQQKSSLRQVAFLPLLITGGSGKKKYWDAGTQSPHTCTEINHHQGRRRENEEPTGTWRETQNVPWNLVTLTFCSRAKHSTGAIGPRDTHPLPTWNAKQPCQAACCGRERGYACRSFSKNPPGT